MLSFSSKPSRYLPRRVTQTSHSARQFYVTVKDENPFRIEDNAQDIYRTATAFKRPSINYATGAKATSVSARPSN